MSALVVLGVKLGLSGVEPRIGHARALDSKPSLAMQVLERTRLGCYLQTNVLQPSYVPSTFPAPHALLVHALLQEVAVLLKNVGRSTAAGLLRGVQDVLRRVE